MNKLYILRPIDGERGAWSPWYDKAFGFIVSAESPAKARKLADEASGDERDPGAIWSKRAWIDARQSTCKELKPTEHSKIIMKDFHAA